MNREKVFYCQSPSLKKELLSIGEKYIAKSKNDNTNRYYWMFLFTDTLVDYLNNRQKIKDKINPNIKSYDKKRQKTL